MNRFARFGERARLPGKPGSTFRAEASGGKVDPPMNNLGSRNKKRIRKPLLMAGALLGAGLLVTATAVVAEGDERDPVTDLVNSMERATTARIEAELRFVTARQELQEALDAEARRASAQPAAPVKPSAAPVKPAATLAEARQRYDTALAALSRSIASEHTEAGRVQDTARLNGVWEAVGSGPTTGIPDRALDILSWASARAFVEHPTCRLDWAVLAAISRVESDHGRYRGAQILRDASVYPRIIGLQLNGDGVAAIADTDGGRFDGDSAFDRAVGPFQFIPSTWERYGRDADGNGLADPNNYRDAALAAADYLCAAGGDLSTDEGLRAAIYAYNHSDEYVATVIELAEAFRSAVRANQS